MAVTIIDPALNRIVFLWLYTISNHILGILISLLSLIFRSAGSHASGLTGGYYMH
jgi:hypothetical protein